MTVTSVTSWSATGQVLSVDPEAGMDREQLGNLRLVHELDLDKSPGRQQGGNPALVYNSSTVSVKPLVQATRPRSMTAMARPGTCACCINRGTSAASPAVIALTSR